MRLITSYKIKLTGDFKALEISLAIYRQTLTYLIPIINDAWEELSQYEFINQIYKVLTQKAHQYGSRIARVNARYTSRLAFDGSGWAKRGSEIAPNTPYSTIQFATGKFYNADLNASYNIGARFFIRHLLKTVTVTQRLALEAKVPQVAKRSTCTLSDLINLRSEFVTLITKTQA